jgi:hypothetical protein
VTTSTSLIKPKYLPEASANVKKSTVGSVDEKWMFPTSFLPDPKGVRNKISGDVFYKIFAKLILAAVVASMTAR